MRDLPARLRTRFMTWWHVRPRWAQLSIAGGVAGVLVGVLIGAAVAAAGGAAHLAGVVASKTTLPVLGVPMKGWALDGLDSLLATVQMPRGVPVATFAIGTAGAVNSALFAGQVLGLQHPEIRDAVSADREERRRKALADSDPRA